MQEAVRHVEIRRCNGATVTCYRPVADGASFYVPKGNLAGPFSPEDCCPALRESLAASAGYEIVYDGPGATIAQPTD